MATTALTSRTAGTRTAARRPRRAAACKPRRLHHRLSLVADVLAEHHAVTRSITDELYVWGCRCGAGSQPGATTNHATAYNRARLHTAESVLSAMTLHGVL